MIKEAKSIIGEVRKVISGKDDVIVKVLIAILAEGHILLEDIPGVGKTTLALTFSKAMGLDFKRIQFTPDVVPSDITGFTMYDTAGGEFKYTPGCVMCNFLLVDEINRTSSKTQAALLEVMQEGAVTVDGIRHETPKPFIVMATQNPIGSAGTQRLPEAQLDRFMIQTSMGYPNFNAQVEMLERRGKGDPLDKVESILNSDELEAMRENVKNIYTDRSIYEYVSEIIEKTRHSEYIKLGLSPRAGISICALARAKAYISERDYVIPADVRSVFVEASQHRLILSSKTQLEGISIDKLLISILKSVKEPEVRVANEIQ